MQNIKGICPYLTETEDHSLECVETSQQLLSILTAYVEVHAKTLNKEATLRIVLATHDIFAESDRKLLEMRLNHSFLKKAHTAD